MRRFQDSSITDLVQRCLHGDDEAWRELVARFGRLVHAIPARQGLSAAEVDDIGQEVFLALSQNLHTIEDPERLPAWLVTTARRATWRAVQRRRYEEPLELVSEDGEERAQPTALVAPFPTPDQLLAGWQRQEVLQRAMEQLSPRCRQLLTLLFLDSEEPNYEEIGRLMDMPKGSIGPTRNRCLDHLRNLMVQSDILESL